MTKLTALIGLLALSCYNTPLAWAGNPDRQGEAGAYELLLNPYARSAGLNGLVCARITGVEATFYNPAGLARLRGTEVAFGHTQYLVGTNMSINSAGLGQKISENGTIGVNLMSFSFGQIPLTTTSQPEGITTFRPNFFNIGISYGHIFRDEEKREKISVGFTARVVSESIANASATGVCFDAGVQYAAGAKRQLRLGVALRNIGSKMRFRGEGLSFPGIAPNGSTTLTIENRTAGFDMPSLLHIGLSYDFLLAPQMSADSVETHQHRLTAMFNFTANSYSRDQLGLALEYGFKEMFFLRTGFRYESQMFDPVTSGTLSSGLTAGLGVEVPLKKGGNKKICFDYAYEYTRVFQGSHSLTARITL
jgi:hypothetical protein